MIKFKRNVKSQESQKWSKTPILGHFRPFCVNFERVYRSDLWELRPEIFRVDAKRAKLCKFTSLKPLNKIFWAPQAKNHKKCHFRPFDGLS